MRAHLHPETIMFIKQTIAIAALALSAGTSHAWSLVYANDASGATTAGSLQALRAAANGGSSVKVLVLTAGHTWQVPCAHVSVRNDSTQAVICTKGSEFHIDVTPGAQFGQVPNPTKFAFFAANTLGQYAQVDMQVSNGSVVSRNTINAQMQWYVE
ncbi:hypothetical protein HQS1_31600 [Delftia lacustris]|nr:hypothetical protein HQS1_31600 [Delftia lacustris]